MICGLPSSSSPLLRGASILLPLLFFLAESEAAATGGGKFAASAPLSSSSSDVRGTKQEEEEGGWEEAREEGEGGGDVVLLEALALRQMPMGAATTGQDSSLKRAAARELGLCDCPFDCLKEEGIRFHNVKLTVHDLSRLVDRLPWRIERALQHKCYSLLTGEDIELFPDLAAAAAARNAEAVSVSRGGQWSDGEGNPSSGSASPNGVVVVAKGSNGVVNGGGGDGGGGGGSGDLVDAFLLPLISILSLMLLVLVILCQRQCILDLAAPLAQQQQQQQQGGGGLRSNSTALVVETVSTDNLSTLRPPEFTMLGGGCVQRSFRNSHSSPQIVITLPPAEDNEVNKRREAELEEEEERRLRGCAGYADNRLYGVPPPQQERNLEPNEEEEEGDGTRPRPFALDLGWFSSRLASSDQDAVPHVATAASCSTLPAASSSSSSDQRRRCRLHRKRKKLRLPGLVGVAVTPPSPPTYSDCCSSGEIQIQNEDEVDDEEDHQPGIRGEYHSQIPPQPPPRLARTTTQQEQQQQQQLGAEERLQLIT